MPTPGESTGTRPVGDGPLALVFGADEGYARALAVAIHSALVNLDPAFAPELYVLDNGLSASSRARLARVVERARRNYDLRWIPVPEARLRHLPTTGYFTLAVYSKLLIPELVSTHIRRAVYLDADVLVRRDLSPLLSMGLDDASFGAVWTVDPENTEAECSDAQNPVPSRMMFNTGLLVIDVQQWRKAGLTDRALEYAAASKEPLALPDQDALNAVADRWHQLDYQWNFQHTLLFDGYAPPTSSEPFRTVFRERWDLYHSAAVLHFVGAKPWKHWCTTPGTRAWVLAMVRTGWYSRAEAAVWLLGWLAKRTRFRLGTARRRSWTRREPA